MANKILRKLRPTGLIYMLIVEFLVKKAFCEAGLNLSHSSSSRSSSISLQCQDKEELFNNCTQLNYWNLEALMVKNIEKENALCGSNKDIGCLNVTVDFENKGCSENKSNDTTKVPDIKKRISLLKILCTKDHGFTCANTLNKAFRLVGKKDKISINFNKESAGCCLHNFQNVYNVSGNVTKKLIKLLVADTNDQMSSYKFQPSTAAIQTKPTAMITTNPTSASQNGALSSPTKGTMAPNSFEKTIASMSGRLIAGLVIACIIFIVVVFVIARFCFQRFQRQKRAKYEDYGYSQLKVILDDHLYDDDEDDEQLLSPT